MLSIIIPVYNGENFLKRCLQSIFNQTNFSFEFEVIVINDGSTDGTLLILNKYKSEYSNFIFRNQINSGTGTARNNGLDLANGKFIWFVDSDDYLEKDAFKVIEKYCFVNDNNITLAFNYYKNNNKQEKSIPDKNTVHKNLEIFTGVNFISPTSNKPFYLWVLIFNKKLLDKFNVRFINGIKNLEDLDFSIKYFTRIDKVVYINQRLYNYCENNLSTSRNLDRNNLLKIGEDTMVVHNSIKNKLTEISCIHSKKIVDQILYKSTIGFFYSLFKFNYTFKELNSYYSLYKNNSLLPTKICTPNLKFFIFENFVNFRRLFLFFAFLKKFHLRYNVCFFF